MAKIFETKEDFERDRSYLFYERAGFNRYPDPLVLKLG